MAVRAASGPAAAPGAGGAAPVIIGPGCWLDRVHDDKPVYEVTFVDVRGRPVPYERSRLNVSALAAASTVIGHAVAGSGKAGQRLALWPGMRGAKTIEDDSHAKLLTSSFAPRNILRLFLLAAHPEAFQHIDVRRASSAEPTPSKPPRRSARATKEVVTALLDAMRTKVVALQVAVACGQSDSIEQQRAALATAKEQVLREANLSQLDEDDEASSLATDVARLARFRQYVLQSYEQPEPSAVVNTTPVSTVPDAVDVATRSKRSRLSVLHAPPLLLMAYVLQAPALEEACLQCIVDRFGCLGQGRAAEQLLPYLLPHHLAAIFQRLSQKIPFEVSSLSCTDSSSPTPMRLSPSPARSHFNVLDRSGTVTPDRQAYGDSTPRRSATPLTPDDQWRQRSLSPSDRPGRRSITPTRRIFEPQMDSPDPPKVTPEMDRRYDSSTGSAASQRSVGSDRPRSWQSSGIRQPWQEGGSRAVEHRLDGGARTVEQHYEEWQEAEGRTRQHDYEDHYEEWEETGDRTAQQRPDGGARTAQHWQEGASHKAMSNESWQDEEEFERTVTRHPTGNAEATSHHAAHYSSDEEDMEEQDAMNGNDLRQSVQALKRHELVEKLLAMRHFEAQQPTVEEIWTGLQDSQSEYGNQSLHYLGESGGSSRSSASAQVSRIPRPTTGHHHASSDGWEMPMQARQATTRRPQTAQPAAGTVKPATKVFDDAGVKRAAERVRQRKVEQQSKKGQDGKDLETRRQRVKQLEEIRRQELARQAARRRSHSVPTASSARKSEQATTPHMHVKSPEVDRELVLEYQRRARSRAREAKRALELQQKLQQEQEELKRAERFAKRDLRLAEYLARQSAHDDVSVRRMTQQEQATRQQLLELAAQQEAFKQMSESKTARSYESPQAAPREDLQEGDSPDSLDEQLEAGPVAVPPVVEAVPPAGSKPRVAAVVPQDRAKRMSALARLNKRKPPSVVAPSAATKVTAVPVSAAMAPSHVQSSPPQDESVVEPSDFSFLGGGTTPHRRARSQPRAASAFMTTRSLLMEDSVLETEIFKALEEQVQP